MRPRFTLLLPMVAVLGSVRTSQAAVITFGFEGVVDSVGSDPLAPISVQPGDRLVYEYTFDTNPPYIGGAGSYAAIDASITVGDDQFLLKPDPLGYPPTLIQAYTSNPGLFGVQSHVGFDVSGLSRRGYVAVSLEGRLRPGNEPPPWWPLLSPPDLSADFTSATWGMNIFGQEYNDPTFQLLGTVTRSYQVPEPTAALLLVLMGILLAGNRRHV